MTRSKSWVGALALVALAACGGGSKNDGTTPTAPPPADDAALAAGDGAPLPAIPATPAAEPTTVLAVVSLGDPVGQLKEIGAFVDVVKPGMGAMLSTSALLPMVGQAIGAPGLAGVATDKPLWVVALDPKTSGGSTLLVVAVADEAALKGSLGAGAEAIVHGGFAAVGTRGSLRAAAPWALSNLAAAAPRKELVAVLRVQRFMASFGGELEQGLKRDKPSEKLAADATLSLMRQVDRAETVFTADPTGVVVTGTVAPVADSKLAQFVAVQRPADYAFAAKLGAGSWPVLAAGRLDFAPLKDFFVAMAAAGGGPSAQVGQVFDMIGGDHAIGVRVTSKAPAISALASVTDGKTAAAAIDAVVAGQAKANPQTWVWDGNPAAIKPAGLKVKGGALHEVGFAPPADAAPEVKKAHAAKWGTAGQKLFAGVLGDVFVFSMDKKAATTLAVNAARTVKPAFDKPSTAALAASVERKESGVVLVDLALLGAEMAEAKQADRARAFKPGQRAPVVFGYGFAAGAIDGRFELPIEQVKAIMKVYVETPPQPAPQG